jgi:hypothetical protein
MRIHRWVKMGLAMGVMLVSGGCAGDMLAPQAAPAPGTPSLPEVLALRAAQMPIRFTEAGAGPASGRIVRRCEMGGRPMEGRPLVIVDGKEMAAGQSLGLDPERIYSVEVLKGSAAVATYGPRAADGAIVFRTTRP